MGMSKKLIVVMAGLSLGACSSVGDKNTFMTYDDLQTKVRTHDEQWQAVQSKLDRIDELEAEVAALKQGKSLSVVPESTSDDLINNNLITDESMAAVNVAPAVMQAPIEGQDNNSASMAVSEEENIEMDKAAPPVVTAPAMSSKTMSSKTISSPTMSTPQETTKQQDYGVQVASYGNRDEALRGWNVLLKNYPTSFDGLVPLVNQKEVNGRTMYQLKVGPFLNKSFSSDFCKMLKEKGKDCLVTRYNGETFVSN
ncbi:SPOR domain-containing protein [Marinomonas rhizomae]|uniref:Sporulation related protein n=1 Tax=Marinomonas rhizomae TaxID=491948 RepID=A0A366JF67_9GAMM|nr:SPOR domain-containing protein [Marinomonas rhizomae]RBP85611.1 sporulation related protein [Marinomonas rhizomae]RNF75761.1 SPOR domain-containing protein [Marinomonas rhizomae]